eukprot:TRINITY_DN10750_c0_g1_i1.p1 TRINITY_DN10750_c0_g1~~TRINITY_DN10750_c0_g1_i1.p1  ORF type:complete len:106 (-),score=5.13 TRINITY_DN10750_c0_g1_i1:69-386(-)
MSSVMHIPQFNIRLCTPTSTSKHIEIAMRFCGRYGIIIQLNNDQLQLRGFNCSWFSRYPEEDERLFFGDIGLFSSNQYALLNTTKFTIEFMSSIILFRITMSIWK